MINTRRGTLLVAILAASSGSLLTAAVEHVALAQQDGIKRTILRRVADPANPNYEIVLGVSELAPGASSGKHRHPGVEVGYVLAGALTVDYEGGKSQTFNPGETTGAENSAIHNARNTGSTTVRTVAVWVVEKGKPLAEPVR